MWRMVAMSGQSLAVYHSCPTTVVNAFVVRYSLNQKRSACQNEIASKIANWMGDADMLLLGTRRSPLAPSSSAILFCMSANVELSTTPDPDKDYSSLYVDILGGLYEFAPPSNLPPAGRIFVFRACGL